MNAAMKDWLYVARRTPVVLWAVGLGLWRNAAPSILMVGAIITGFMLGAAGVSGWLLIAPIAFGSFAIGLSADRGEARGRNATGNAFLRMLEDDRTINIIVTKQAEAS